MREALERKHRSARVQALEGCHDAGVEVPPPVREKALVRHLVGQLVRERVLLLRREGCLVEELGNPQPSELAAQPLVRLLPDGLEECLGDDRPDYGGRLEEPLGLRRQAVDPGREEDPDAPGDLDALHVLDGAIGARAAHEDRRLDEAPHALLEKERVPSRALDQPAPERSECGIGAQERLEQVLGRLRPQRIDAKLRVVGPPGEGMLVLRAVAHHEQYAGHRQALGHEVQGGLTLRIDPLHVFEDEQHGLALAFPQNEPLERVQRAALATTAVERAKRVLGREGAQEAQERGGRISESLVERREGCRHLVADHEARVPIADPEIAPQQLDDWQGGRSPSRAGLRRPGARASPGPGAGA